MSRQNLALLMGVVGLVTFGLAGTHLVSWAQERKERSDQRYARVRLMIDVLEEVDSKYVNDLSEERKRKLVEDMINGGLERLDPHSSYINPKEYKQFRKQSDGKFGGVGIQITTDRQTGALQVISPMVGTPAYEAGVLPGDLITKIDGKSTENMRLSEAVELIQGEPGQKVVLTVLHEGSKEPVDLAMIRAEIKVQSVLGDQRKPGNPKEWDYFIDKDKGIAYIRLVSFSENAAEELKQALLECKSANLRGLILDLRNNPGGLLRSAVDITNLFLPEGVIVSTRGRNHRGETHEASPRKHILSAEACPMVILINKYSASASEIVAAALQDHKRAVIIGERSFGKGSVQNVIPMEGRSSALKLTTASYWRPSGKNIHRFTDAKETDDWGVKPNPGFEIPMKDDERLEYVIYRRDRDIVPGKAGPAKAAEPAKDKDQSSGKDKDKPKKPFEDRALQKALEYLRGEIKTAEIAPAESAAT